MIWKSYLNLYAGESVKIKPGHLVVLVLHKATSQKYYFPGMFNLVRGFVKCYLEGQNMKKKTDGARVQEFIIQNIGKRNHG